MQTPSLSTSTVSTGTLGSLLCSASANCTKWRERQITELMLFSYYNIFLLLHKVEGERDYRTDAFFLLQHISTSAQSFSYYNIFLLLHKAFPITTYFYFCTKLFLLQHISTSAQSFSYYNIFLLLHKAEGETEVTRLMLLPFYNIFLLCCMKSSTV